MVAPEVGIYCMNNNDKMFYSNIIMGLTRSIHERERLWLVCSVPYSSITGLLYTPLVSYVQNNSTVPTMTDLFPESGYY